MARLLARLVDAPYVTLPSSTRSAGKHLGKERACHRLVGVPAPRPAVQHLGTRRFDEPLVAEAVKCTVERPGPEPDAAARQSRTSRMIP